MLNMKREQAEAIARKFTDHLISISPNKRPSTNHLMVNAIMEAVAIEREECAKPLDEAAARLLAPKRTNEVDRHVANVLQQQAATIRARSGQ